MEFKSNYYNKVHKKKRNIYEKSKDYLYFHMNWGWGGSGNAWYAFNHFNTSNGSFNYLTKMIYNIKP